MRAQRRCALRRNAASSQCARCCWLLRLAAGVVSAFAFEPVGWWPLMLVAFAALCELLDRTDSLWRALAIGWAFGVGQFVVGLNWIATAFTYQAAMPAWLGWVAVVLLSLYLAIYPALAAGLAWRFGATTGRAGHRARPAPGRSPNGCAATVHRLRLEPGRRGAGADPADRRYGAGRHLRPVDDRRAARRRHLARILPQVAALVVVVLLHCLAVDCCRLPRPRATR